MQGQTVDAATRTDPRRTDPGRTTGSGTSPGAGRTGDALRVVRQVPEQARSSERAITVSVRSTDGLSRAGVEHLLRSCCGVVVADGPGDVTLVVAEQLDEAALGQVRAARAQGGRVLLVLQQLDDSGLLSAVEAGACALLRRASASADALERAVRAAAAGDGSLPPDLLGRLLTHVQAVQQRVLTPRGLTWGELSTRETEVLRLIAEGQDTSEVARALNWSERTVKNVVHDVTTRLHLRNRAHAVAYAVRHGLI